jgi:hypothetical protein
MVHDDDEPLKDYTIHDDGRDWAFYVVAFALGGIALLSAVFAVGAARF